MNHRFNKVIGDLDERMGGVREWVHERAGGGGLGDSEHRQVFGGIFP